MPPTVRQFALLAAVLALLAAFAPAAHGASAAQIIAALNQQRTDHGIPAGIVQNATWSEDCRKHNNWMAENQTLSHEEQPNTPGYTPEGNWAGTHAVIAVGAPDFRKPSQNPYLNAPYHLAQLLHPSLNVMGANESRGYDCETTFPGYGRGHPATNTLYSYPGTGKTITWLQTPREGPSVPGDAVGLPQGTTTGPNLIVYWDGPPSPAPLSDVTSASLTDLTKHAQVEIRVVDDRNGSAFSGTGFLIPVKPLKPGRQYEGKVTFGSSTQPARTFTKRWMFRTTELRTGKKAVKLATTRSGNSVRVQAVPLDEAYRGRPATLHADYGPGFQIDPFDIQIGNGYAVLPAPAKGKKLKLTLRVKPFNVGGTKVKAFKLKKTVKG
jgi:hypothetical protein